MLLTDEEQRKLNDEMFTDGPTTEKINRSLSAAEERILKQFRPVVEKVERHDNFIAGLTKRMTESFSGLLRLDEKLNIKK